jgi:hypothetical protein
VFLVDEHGVFGFACRDPGTSVLCAAGVLSHRNNLKVLTLEFLIEGLPAWQIKTATSPGGPGNQQNFLSPKV